MKDWEWLIWLNPKGRERKWKMRMRSERGVIGYLIELSFYFDYFSCV